MTPAFKRDAIGWLADDLITPIPTGDAIGWLAESSPWALLAMVILGILSYALRLFADISPTVSRALGILGRHWRRKSQERYIKQGAALASMNSQILHLSDRNRVLEYESAMDHSFRVQDEHYHRNLDLILAQVLDDETKNRVPQRVTYQEFVSKYKELYPLEYQPFQWK